MRYCWSYKGNINTPALPMCPKAAAFHTSLVYFKTLQHFSTSAQGSCVGTTDTTSTSLRPGNQASMPNL